MPSLLENHLPSKPQLELVIITMWEKFFSPHSYWIRNFLAFLTLVFGLLLTGLMKSETGIYFPLVTIIVIFLITLLAGWWLGLIATVVLVVLTDYFFLEPFGTVLLTPESFHNLYIICAFGLAVSILSASLRLSIRQLLMARRHAEDVAKTMERMLLMVSHDIRNPLAAAKMSIQMSLRYQMAPETQNRFSGRAIESLDRADQLIETLLDLGRMRAGHILNLNFKTCDLVVVIKKTVEELRAYNVERVRLEIPEKLIGIWSEEGMRRALENLLTNAFKYGEPKGEIRVTLAQMDSIVKLSVHNKGEPIALSDQGALFEPFYRAGRTDPNGWGLGLPLVKGIVQAHGGQIEITSTPVHGTTFSLLLPLRT